MSQEEPLLLSESTTHKLPKTVETLIEENTKQEMISSQELRLQILSLLIYYVCLENGFTIYEDGQNTANQSIEWGFDIRKIQQSGKSVPSNFRNQSYFRLDLKLIGDDTKCILLMLRSGDSLLCTLTSERYKGYSLLLSAAKYVPFVNKKNLASSFRNMLQFSIELKNQLVLPMMNSILAAKPQLYPGLLGLPVFCYDSIFPYLKVRDLQNLALTCKLMCREVQEFRARRLLQVRVVK